MRRNDVKDSLIVALDTDVHTTLSIAHSLQGRVRWLKVGMTLYYLEGPKIVATLHEMGFNIFLDLKLHDIPHQVEGAARSVASLGVGMMTVHAAGGQAMMEAAVQGARDGSAECGTIAPDILAVTVLTSMDEDVLASVGVGQSVSTQVDELTHLARKAGVQGVVCSPKEAARARTIMGPEALVVTPGVRPSWASTDDQARVATPAQAIESGASHLVVGRPITGAEEPSSAAMQILEEM